MSIPQSFSIKFISLKESPGPANYNARGMTRFGPADGIKAKVIGRPRDLCKFKHKIIAANQ